MFVAVRRCNPGFARSGLRTVHAADGRLADSPNRVFTRGELVDACLMDADALERTVDSHISRLRRKLQCAGASAMPEVMRGVGYRLRGAR